MSATENLSREERLRTAAGLRGSPALALSAWRGASGRRYVVGIHALDLDVDPTEFGESVLIAVSRDAKGVAQPVGVAACGSGASRGLLAGFRKKGATELHVHRLAEGEDARAAIVSDLQP